LHQTQLPTLSDQDLFAIFRKEYEQEILTYNKLLAKNHLATQQIKSLLDVFKDYGNTVASFLNQQQENLISIGQPQNPELTVQIKNINSLNIAISELISKYPQDSKPSDIEGKISDNGTDRDKIISIINKTKAVNELRKLLGIDNSFYQETLEKLVTKFQQFSEKFEIIIDKSLESTSEEIPTVFFEDLSELLTSFDKKLQDNKPNTSELKTPATALGPTFDQDNFDKFVKQTLENSCTEGLRTFNKLGDKNRAVGEQIDRLSSILTTNCSIAYRLLDQSADQQDNSNLKKQIQELIEANQISKEAFVDDKKNAEIKTDQPETLAGIIEHKAKLDGLRKERAGLNTQYQGILNDFLAFNLQFSVNFFDLCDKIKNPSAEPLASDLDQEKLTENKDKLTAIIDKISAISNTSASPSPAQASALGGHKSQVSRV